MKEIIIKALVWCGAMMLGLAALDLLRGDAINWFIAAAGGAVFFVFKLMLGVAQARRSQEKGGSEKDK